MFSLKTLDLFGKLSYTAYKIWQLPHGGLLAKLLFMILRRETGHNGTGGNVG